MKKIFFISLALLLLPVLVFAEGAAVGVNPHSGLSTVGKAAGIILLPKGAKKVLVPVIAGTSLAGHLKKAHDAQSMLTDVEIEEKVNSLAKVAQEVAEKERNEK